MRRGIAKRRDCLNIHTCCTCHNTFQRCVIFQMPNRSTTVEYRFIGTSTFILSATEKAMAVPKASLPQKKRELQVKLDLVHPQGFPWRGKECRKDRV
jgi:hypothetical protein